MAQLNRKPLYVNQLKLKSLQLPTLIAFGINIVDSFQNKMTDKPLKKWKNNSQNNAMKTSHKTHLYLA